MKNGISAILSVFVCPCVLWGATITQPVYLSASGNNSLDGLSPATAWETVDAIDSRTFGAGAQILFNRSDTFAGTCTLSGSGSVSEPIVIGTYGAGEKPLLTGDPNAAEIFKLTNNGFIEFHDLQLSNFNTNNPSIAERYGIRILPPQASGEINHLYFKNLDFFDFRGYGEPVHEDDHRSTCILAETVDSDANSKRSRFSDFLVEGCTFRDIDGLGARLSDTSQDIADKKIRGTDYFPTVGFVFQNNYGTNIYRNLLMIRGTKDALVQYNTMDTTVEGSAFWPFGCDGTVVQHNLFMNLFASDADAYVCHFDYNCIDTLMQYNIGYNVEGGLIEYIVNSEWAGMFQENGIARYNIGIDVGWREDSSNPGTSKPNGAGIFLTGRVTGGQFYNNTIIQLSKPQYQAISFNNWGGEWPTNNIIYNNIFYAADTVSTYNQPLRGTLNDNIVSHNLYWGNVAPPEVWDGTPVDQNPFTNNPVFSNSAGLAAEDFKVLYGSAAISNGLLIADNGGHDYFGGSVTSNSSPTLGFHEYLSDATIDSDGDKMPDSWESGHSLNPGSPADAMLDPDNDQLENLGEFAMGGDPGDGNDTGYPQRWIQVDGEMVFIHPRRIGSELTYLVETSTNLVSNGWTNSGYAVSGIGAIDADFESITNDVSTSGSQGFVRLRIE